MVGKPCLLGICSNVERKDTFDIMAFGIVTLNNVSQQHGYELEVAMAETAYLPQLLKVLRSLTTWHCSTHTEEMGQRQNTVPGQKIERDRKDQQKKYSAHRKRFQPASILPSSTRGYLQFGPISEATCCV